MKKTIIRTT